MKIETLYKLQNVCIEAIEYVGSANYQEREIHAMKEINRCFEAARKGNIRAIEFRYMKWKKEEKGGRR